jgi:hypothetical protein
MFKKILTLGSKRKIRTRNKKCLRSFKVLKICEQYLGEEGFQELGMTSEASFNLEGFVDFKNLIEVWRSQEELSLDPWKQR